MKRQQYLLLLSTKKRSRGTLDFCSTTHQAKVERSVPLFFAPCPTAVGGNFVSSPPQAEEENSFFNLSRISSHHHFPCKNIIFIMQAVKVNTGCQRRSFHIHFMISLHLLR